MRQIIKDWCDFCEGKNDFDKSHFYTLLWDDSESEKLTSRDVEIIFSYFEEKDKLIEIIDDYLFNVEKKKVISDEDLIFLATEDVNEKAKLLKESNYKLNRNIIFEENFNMVEESRNNSEYLMFYDEVSDVILDSWKLEDKKTNALYEALYGLTADYEMVWYLFSPLLNVSVTFFNYFQLKINNGIYSIINNEIVVSREN